MEGAVMPPDEEILIEMKPKKKTDLEKIGRELNNELINYAAIQIRGIKTKDMRLEIVKRALGSHQKIEDTERDLEGWEDDPEGINIPWEEKYGKD